MQIPLQLTFEGF
jgi:ribosome-associated translation inhibitor RaiA